MLRYLFNIQQSYSVAFADFVRLRESEGRSIVKMQTGDPDFNTHPSIVATAQEALHKGETKYCDSRGLVVLRKALSDKLFRDNNINVDPGENILVTHGAVHGIGMAIKALLNPGDECIILEPFWRSYEANVILAGGIPVVVQTRKEKGFQLESSKVLEKITSKTKLIIINTPNNPSGAVYDRRELILLAQGAAIKGVYILSDEVYESIIFGSGVHYSIGSDPLVSEWIISAFSFSKTYAMTGWRVGYIIASKKIIDEMLKLSQFSITSLSPYNQLAASTALKDPQSQLYTKYMKGEYEKRLHRITEKIKGTWLQEASTIPEATFYVLIDTSRFGMGSLELAKKIVDSYNVSFTPGIAFGDNMDSYLRMCFATSDENIDVAIEALVNYEIS